MTPATDSRSSRTIRRHLAAALLLVAILVFGLLGWAMHARLAGAVVAGGVVVVEGNVKRVQHREGGIVGEIYVKDGTPVEAGDLLVRLDDTLTKANLAIVEKQIHELLARHVRLVAERDGTEDMDTPDELEDRDDELDVQELLLAERALFAARKQMLEGQKKQLRERIEQIGQEISGLAVRRSGKDDELKWIEQELEGIEFLYEKALVPFPRVAALRRQKAQLTGERGQLTAEIARAETRITETNLQILQLDQDRLTEVLGELRDVTARLAELAERRVAALDQLTRSDIRAPQPGIVHELGVHTIGGVIGPGETLMLIVPSQDSLIVQAQLNPADIDQVHIGQPVVLRFSAFNQRTTPEIIGTVKNVAADRTLDPETGLAWYTARVEIPTVEFAKLGQLALVPGMPVETFIQTGERTALSYLLKPLSDQLNRAFREE